MNLKSTNRRAGEEVYIIALALLAVFGLAFLFNTGLRAPAGQQSVGVQVGPPALFPNTFGSTPSPGGGGSPATFPASGVPAPHTAPGTQTTTTAPQPGGGICPPQTAVNPSRAVFYSVPASVTSCAAFFSALVTSGGIRFRTYAAERTVELPTCPPNPCTINNQPGICQNDGPPVTVDEVLPLAGSPLQVMTDSHVWSVIRHFHLEPLFFLLPPGPYCGLLERMQQNCACNINAVPPVQGGPGKNTGGGGAGGTTGGNR